MIYKHIGISNGFPCFEWFSEDPDPSKTNPYPGDRYKNLKFETKSASATESDEYAKDQIRFAQRYLKSTDWYVIRELETGKPCPPEVKLEREKARLKAGL